ncbi:hypothetical protein [Ralstonia pseudosolanacearum]|uniref:hypothetical protein n=1 Tax=Ralstonia pseudosolanacearum TaxID=1310165 RepID=UPI001E460AA4|nr:hypothetical protein [Ralstonia pseudosolanacearum]
MHTQLDIRRGLGGPYRLYSRAPGRANNRCNQFGFKASPATHDFDGRVQPLDSSRALRPKAPY